MENETTGVVAAESVVTEADGKDTQSTERTYSESDIQKMIDGRFKKHNAEKADLLKKLAEAEEKATRKVSPNVEEEMRDKLKKYETDIKSRDEKLAEYREKQMTAEIYRELDDCVDPEVVIDHFINRKLVHLDSHGEMVVENVSGSLRNLVSDFLEKRPHLRKSQTTTGVGSRSPHKVAVNAGTPADQRLAEASAALGIDMNKIRQNNQTKR